MFSRFTHSPSKIFAVLSAMFCFGILFGSFFLSVSLITWIFILCVTVLVATFLTDRKHRLFVLSLFMFAFGLFRYTQSEIPKNISTVRDFTGQILRIEGDVIAEPAMRSKSNQITIGNVRVVDREVFGHVLVSIPKEQEITYGDHLVFSCSLQIPRPFNGFAYDRYLESKGTLALCRFPHELDRAASKRFSLIGSIFSFKHQLVEKMKHVFPEPHASFLFGLVFGGNSGIDGDLQNNFIKTGTSHILAASGFNVSLFTFVFFGFVIQ
ncbi:MAG: ComEC/Rec2 family competence protein, partial [Patescibacteria group bacterium]